MSPTGDQHEEQLQLQKQKLLEELENELKRNISQEKRTRLEATLTALNKDQHESVMRLICEEYMAYKTGKINVKPSSKRRSFEEIYAEKAGDLIESLYAIRMDPELPKEKYKSEDAIEDRVRELADKFCTLTQCELVSQLVGATAKIELLKQEIDELRSVNRYLIDHFEKDLSKREATVSRQKAGKDKKFSDNNQCMKECLDEVLNSGSPAKEPSKRDYRQFCRLLKDRYPTPPFRQKPRLDSEEKKQDLETQTADREALQKYEWAETTLRNFFEKTLNVNIADLS